MGLDAKSYVVQDGQVQADVARHFDRKIFSPAMARHLRWYKYRKEHGAEATDIEDVVSKRTSVAQRVQLLESYADDVEEILSAKEGQEEILRDVHAIRALIRKIHAINKGDDADHHFAELGDDLQIYQLCKMATRIQTAVLNPGPVMHYVADVIRELKHGIGSTIRGSRQ